MATANSGAWAKPGAWALQSEEHAATEDKFSSFPSLTPPTSSDSSADFPPLTISAVSKASKKKKAQPLSLSEFTGGKTVSHGTAARSRTSDGLYSSSKSLTLDEPIHLPTGPRERSAEELERSSRGFGYSTYGGGGARRMDGSASRDSGDETRRNSLNRDSGPSRADEVDDWGSMKRSVGPPERRGKGGVFFDSQSRADDVDNWISKRAPSLDGPREKRGSFEMFSKERSDVGGADSDTWGKKKEEGVRADLDRCGRRRDDVYGEVSDTWGRKREEVSAGNGERPRIVLQPRSLPLTNGSSDGIGEPILLEKPTPIVNSKRSNPFGLARPREEVLAEKGQDWKKLEEKLESTKLREAEPDGLSFGKKGLNSANGSLPEDRTEKSWRKEIASVSHASIIDDQRELNLLKMRASEVA